MDKAELINLKKETAVEAKIDDKTQEKTQAKPGFPAKLSAGCKRICTKKTAIIGAAILGFIVIGIALRLTVFKPGPKQVYAVAVMVRSQSNKDPVEDRKTSLKAGDVLSVQDAEHKWSKTETISYLILKMNLSEEQKQKLTRGEERKIKYKELSEEEQARIEEEKKRAKEEDRDYEPEPRTETLRAREYYVDLSRKEFEGFKAMDLYNGQPFQEKIYDWRIVEKKKSVLKET